MIQHNDLHRYCQADDIDFDDEQINEIITSADLHLVQHGFPGFFILPILYIIVGYTSSFATDYFAIFSSGAVSLLFACLGAVYAGIKLRSPVTHARIFWQRCYYFTTLATALCWGILAALFLFYYKASWETVIVLYLTAGIGGGSVSSASNWMNLNRFYLILLFAPIIIVSFIFSEDSLMVVGFLSLIGFIYNFGQIKLGNRIYWDSLVGKYRLQQEVTARKKSQQALQQERDAFMTGPVMLFTWQHKENWPVEHVSENVFQILGYSTQEFIDGSVQYANLVHPDDLERVTDELESSFDEEGDDFYTHKPYRLKSRSGETIWVLDSTSLIRNIKMKSLITMAI